MEITALGMIETSGLLTAIEAADAGLKAANVRLLGTDYVRGGLVMVRFEGDVAAVQAAVDAGTMAAQRVGYVVSSHVIPRAMPEVFCMLASDPGVGPGKRSQGGCAACGGCEGGMREMRNCRASAQGRPEKQGQNKADDRQTRDSEGKQGQEKIRDKQQRDVQRKVNQEETSGRQPQDSVLPSMEELRKWKVLALRSFVRKLPGFPLKAAEIRYANKEMLLTALEEYSGKRE